MSPAFILRSALAGEQASSLHPDSVFAWAPEPDTSLAPSEAWEEVQDLEAALVEAPPAAIPPVPAPPPEPVPPNPALLVKQRILEAMEFGKQLMAEYGAQNVLAGRSTADIAAISDKLSTVQARLLSGSLYAALEAIDALQPDALVSEASIAEFRAKIQAYLAPAQEGPAS